MTTHSDDIGVIEWVLQKSHLETVITAAETITVGVTAANVSNLLLVLYVISYIVTRKAAFIVAFLFVETIGMIDPFEHYFIAPTAINVTYEYYYFIYAGLYSICYLYFFFIYQSLKTCLGYFILMTLSYRRLSSYSQVISSKFSFFFLVPFIFTF